MDKELIKHNLQNITDLLYQQNMQESYAQLAWLLPQMEQWIACSEEEQQKELTDILQSALEAMEQMDLTLLADILQYDLLEKLEEI